MIGRFYTLHKGLLRKGVTSERSTHRLVLPRTSPRKLGPQAIGPQANGPRANGWSTGFVVRLVTSLWFACLISADSVVTAEENKIQFEDGVQAVFKEKCGKCHREDLRKGELDLSSMSAIHQGGESGEPLLAETLDDSYLWSVIESEEMPPDGEPALTSGERKMIRKWIAAGGHSRVAIDHAAESLDQHDVLPILLLRCNTCHGPRLQRGGVDLRTRASMVKGGKNGPAMIPGDADASLMIQRIETHACPPGDQLLKFFVRRPPKSEIDVLRKWIDAGAPLSEQADQSDLELAHRSVTQDEKNHWAFRPPKKVGGLSSVDQFVARRLEEAGLEFAAEADRDTLIRRAFIDLIGIPPTRDQYHHWRNLGESNWFELMVDDLLASEHYGERWGRYWLDLAGYADSEGGISADPIRENAWKYRDYVVSSFNQDKPYDRFLLEQIAGDELVDYENAKTITDEMVDNLVATGFLRMGIDETGSRTMNFVPERIKVISDAITVVSAGLMGLTMDCARCHSHKYDPIPHRDYYRLKAVFQGALDEHDWDSFKTRKLDVATAGHRARVAEFNGPHKVELKKLQSLEKKLTAQLQLELLRHHYPDQSDDDNQATLTALKKADNNRTLKQKQLVERLAKAELKPEAEQPEQVLAIQNELSETARQIDRTRRKMVPSTTIRALWDRGRPSPTYILRRGEHDKPGDPVTPGVPSVLSDGPAPYVIQEPFPGGTTKTGRRLAFAKWLTDPKHPTTARVMVNRIWHHHFGSGLVKDLENFGIKGERPTHPDLLDWLAVEFVEGDWSIKTLHRTIMNSRTYRQSSRVSKEANRIDPQNRLLSRMNLRRLDAEALRDSLLLVSGKLDTTPGGMPDTVTVDRDGMVHVNPTEGGGLRRSLYLQYRRTEIPTMMDTFDYPPMGPNCLSRNVSTISPQALMLMNNARIRELSSELAGRIIEETEQRKHGRRDDSHHEAWIRLVYETALTRQPGTEELGLGLTTFDRLTEAWDGDQRKALETFCHTILNSASFLYVD